ncbi:MAG: hypothetical protein IPG76_05155 [Acidobacteria bacterium]|nr:hypothetical protein [Acidobacteriota bacterium]
MKSIFICYGLAWFTAIIFVLVMAVQNGRSWLLSVGTLWYLPVGTAISLLIAALTLVSIFLNKGQS